MKTFKQLAAATALTLFICWPWLLRGVDLVWMVVFGEWLTRGNWWSAVWTDGTYQVWPLYACVILFVFMLLAFMLRETFAQGSDEGEQ